MSELCLTEAGYGAMTTMMIAAAEKLCKGKLVMELEGGYNLKSLSQSNLEIVYSLLGVSHAKVAGKPKERTVELVNKLKNKFSEYHKL